MSKEANEIAVNIDVLTTTTVSILFCLYVGQLICFNVKKIDFFIFER